MGTPLILDMAASSHPDRAAFTVDGTTLDYAQFAELVALVGAELQRSGARHVVFLGGSGVELPAVLFGAAYAGLPFTPLNYRLGDLQLTRLLNRIDDAIVIVDAAYVDAVREVSHPVRTCDAFMRQARAAADKPLPPVDIDEESPAVILFTSGTTSEPKGVVLRHSHLMSYVMETCEFGSAAPSDAALISVPPYHVAGVGTILTNTYAGRRMVYLPQFTPERWVALAREEHVTSAMVVPTMLERIIRSTGGVPLDLPALRTLSYGGARLPRPTLEQALRTFPDVGFVNAYGLTETSSTIALLGPDDHRDAFHSDDPQVQARLASIGRPVPGVEVEIRGFDGLPVRTAEQGELWVRGPQVSGEYMGAHSTLDKEGWFPTRDVAYQDAAGYLYIIGRNDDTIIRGGENIAPAEIEDVLIEHPLVQSAVVVGVPDEQWGEATAAAVVLEPDNELDVEELRQYVRARLRGSRTPDRVVYLDELPVTPSGKILRKDIVAHIKQTSATASGQPG
ncbi:class I adenylate-forming enzyme family protein [Streptomyces sp. NPDC096311]|uniref:class I adenylate-forming enzyme family protein n=1 Tax=Streptomyces sp. NPDC096311 TaxID=3366083 RepID=UPI0038032103